MRPLRTRTTALLILFAVLARPAAAAAQDQRVAILTHQLTPGGLVTVTADGTTYEGPFVDLTADTLRIATSASAEPVRVPVSRLERVRYADSVANGTLTGLLVGAIPGVLIGSWARTYCRNEAGKCDAAPFVMGGVVGGLGALIGFSIDEAVRTTLRFGPRAASVSFGVVADPRRPAARLSLRF